MLEGPHSLRRALPTLVGVSSSDEPEQAPPWRPEYGPKPTVWTWPPGDRPALRVLANGAWRYAAVEARHNYEDGRVAYQVLIDVDGSGSMTHRTYWWQPESGRMKRAHRTRGSQPSTGTPKGEELGGLPRAPHQSVTQPAPSPERAQRPPRA